MMGTDPQHHAIGYGSDPSQVGDLYLPVPKADVKGTAKVPVVCLIHGGFWRMPYARDLMAPLAVDLVGRGFAVWNIEYRRLGSGGGWPATLLDISKGVDHLASLAHAHALDLDQVITVGHSAGGHLALWAAGRHHAAELEPTFRPRVRVTAAVGQAPVADLRRAYDLHLSGEVVAELLGGSPGEHPERYAAASPRQLLPLGVPQLIVHGETDEVVPLEIGHAYAMVARAVGDPVTFTGIPGMGHFEHLEVSGPAWAAVTGWLDRHTKRP